MGITNKYELETVNYGTTGWNALNATSFQKLDDNVHTYLRYPVAAGETIAEYDPVMLINGEWHKALADGNKMPAMGIAIEAGLSGEYLRAQRVGPLTNAAWSFVPSGEVYLTASGELSQTKPASNTQIVGLAISQTILMVNPSVETNVGSGTGGGLTAADIVTTVSDPGSDSKIPSEQAVREFVSGEYLLKTSIITTVGTPGSDTRVPSEAAVRTAIGAGGYIPKPATTVSGEIAVWAAASGELSTFSYKVGTSAGNLVQLDGSAKLPAVDGSQLTGITGTGTYSGEVVFIKTDNYTLLASDLNNVFAMNSAVEKSFTLPSVGSAQNGKYAIFQKLGAGKLNIVAVDTDKTGWQSSAPGTLYNAQAEELGASITLRYSDTITTWIIECASGTWGTI